MPRLTPGCRLHRRVISKHSWEIVREFTDQGVSGIKGRDKRPGFDALHKAIARREVDLVAAWSVDRLGRSLRDLIGFLNELRAKGADLYLHQQGGSTPGHQPAVLCLRCRGFSPSLSAR
jgi:DNA invertase Pin-like site-specific DNA recombinase